MGDGGVDLARKFVELSDELEAVRGAIKLAVLNGAGHSHRPFVPAVRRRLGGEEAAATLERKVFRASRPRKFGAVPAFDQATASVGSPQGGVIYVSSGFVSLDGKCER